jgi:hypothetical protein
MTKQYTIGGRSYELRPLTWRQRQRASAVERELRGRIVDLARLTNKPESAAEDSLSQIFSVSCRIDDILLAEDKRFPKFLATILTPSSQAQWTEGMIDTNAPQMEEMDEETLSEVIVDFFGRRGGKTPLTGGLLEIVPPPEGSGPVGASKSSVADESQRKMTPTSGASTP